jgi:hypothetical protein
LPPLINAVPTPDVPNHWDTARSLGHQEQKRKACQEVILDDTKMQLNHILGEYQNLPFHAQHSKRGTYNIPMVSTFDWPNNLINQIREVMHTPCNTPMPPEFSFELTGEAALQYINILRKYNFDLGRALESNKVPRSAPGKNSDHQTSSAKFLACTHYGLK